MTKNDCLTPSPRHNTSPGAIFGGRALGDVLSGYAGCIKKSAFSNVASFCACGPNTGNFAPRVQRSFEQSAACKSEIARFARSSCPGLRSLPCRLVAWSAVTAARQQLRRSSFSPKSQRAPKACPGGGITRRTQHSLRRIAARAESSRDIDARTRRRSIERRDSTSNNFEGI